MVAVQGLVTSVYVGGEGPSLQLRTNGRFGSIRPICRAIGEDRFLRTTAMILVTRLFRHRGLKDDLIATGPLSDEVLRLEID